MQWPTVSVRDAFAVFTRFAGIVQGVVVQIAANTCSFSDTSSFNFPIVSAKRKIIVPKFTRGNLAYRARLR
jgi:hypothetical protein